MTAANVVRLPSAASERVVQERRAGRTPKSVPRISNFLLRGYMLRLQRELISNEIKSMRSVISFSEHSIQLARLRIAKLEALKIGSALADQVATRLEWEKLSLEDRARSYGGGEPVDLTR